MHLEVHGVVGHMQFPSRWHLYQVNLSVDESHENQSCLNSSSRTRSPFVTFVLPNMEVLRKYAFSLLALASIATAASNSSTPVYKNPNATIDDRVSDLLGRMTIQDKTAQLLQGDVSNWLNTTDGSFNASGLVFNMEYRAGSFYVGYYLNWTTLSDAVKIGQDYLTTNTTLGIPAWVQSEGIHGFLIPNATIFNSPIAQACSWNPDLVGKMGEAIAQEAAALGVVSLFVSLQMRSHTFAANIPV